MNGNQSVHNVLLRLKSKSLPSISRPPQSSIKLQHLKQFLFQRKVSKAAPLHNMCLMINRKQSRPSESVIGDLSQNDQMSTEAKIISERNVKKLQQRYQTVDRWKQKYIGQDASAGGRIRVQVKLPHLHNRSGSVDIKNSLKAIHQREAKSKQIEIEIMQKIEKFNQLEAQREIMDRDGTGVNYFQEKTYVIPPEKKRQHQIKKKYVLYSNQMKGEGLYLKKAALQIRKDKGSKQKAIWEISKKADPSSQMQVHVVNTNTLPSSTHEKRRQKLMQDLMAETPIGWPTHIHQDDEQIKIHSDAYSTPHFQPITDAS